MTALTNSVPDGYHAVSPYLVLPDTKAAIAFYQAAFGATELMRIVAETGRVRHAEIEIGGSEIMLTDETPDFPLMRSPLSLGGSSVHLHLYVADVDAVIGRAVAAGATVLMPPEDQGEDRRGGLADPFGHVWWVATRIEDVSREEIQRRMTVPGEG